MPETTAMGNADVTDDLAAFAAEMYGTDTKEPKDATEPESDSADRSKPVDSGEGNEGDPAEADDPESDTDGQRAEKQKRSTADRIRKLHAQAKTAERENAELRARLEALEAAQKKPLTEENPTDNTADVQAPDPAKYKFGELDPQYVRDLARFEAKAEIKALLDEQERARKAEAAKTEADQALVQVREQAARITEAGLAKFPDFQSVVVEAAMAEEFALTREMFEIAAETEVAAEILYHLATNPEESAKVAEMSPRQQALWFGRMEAKFSAPAPAAKKTTAAPPPPASLPKGNGGKGGVSIYDTEDPRALDLMTKALFGKE